MSEYRFRQLDQEWGRIEDREAELAKARTPRRTGYSMTLRWARFQCAEWFLNLDHGEAILARNWRAYNAFIATRLRLLARADELERAIEEAQ